MLFALTPVCSSHNGGEKQRANCAAGNERRCLEVFYCFIVARGHLLELDYCWKLSDDALIQLWRGTSWLTKNGSKINDRLQTIICSVFIILQPIMPIEESIRGPWMPLLNSVWRFQQLTSVPHLFIFFWILIHNWDVQFAIHYRALEWEEQMFPRVLCMPGLLIVPRVTRTENVSLSPGPRGFFTFFGGVFQKDGTIFTFEKSGNNHHFKDPTKEGESMESNKPIYCHCHQTSYWH